MIKKKNNYLMQFIGKRIQSKNWNDSENYYFKLLHIGFHWNNFKNKTIYVYYNIAFILITVNINIKVYLFLI